MTKLPIKPGTPVVRITPPDKSKIVDEATLEAYVEECLQKCVACHVIELPSSQYDQLWGSPSEHAEFGLNTRFGLITIRRTPS